MSDIHSEETGIPASSTGSNIATVAKFAPTRKVASESSTGSVVAVVTAVVSLVAAVVLSVDAVLLLTVGAVLPTVAAVVPLPCQSHMRP